MRVRSANLEAHIECRPVKLPALVELAERVDKFADVESPPDGYGLAEAVAAIFNGGTAEEIQAALTILAGWSFQPVSNGPHDRKESP